MGFWSAIPIIGNVIDGVLGLIDQSVEDKDKAREAKAAITQALMASDLTKFAEQIKAQASIVLAEAQGQSWLQRNWRPLLMLTIVAIVANNYLVAPYARAMGLDAPMLDLPERLWDLMSIGLGGYVVGRSGEKIMEAWSKK